MISNVQEKNISFLDKKEQEINVATNENCTLVLSNIFDASLNLFLQKDSNCKLLVFFKDEKNSLVLRANLMENANLEIYFADFSSGNSELSSNVILLGEGSESIFKFSSLTKNNDIKKYQISFSHIGEKTKSNLEGYSVNMNTSKLKVDGVSHIEKSSVKANAKQKVKAILFDKESAAIANPILKIDCEDIEASHACAIGSLNENHLFYLLSRGISLSDARKLITIGYLSPIVNNFNESDKEELESYIQREL